MRFYGLMTMRHPQEVTAGDIAAHHLGYRLPDTDISHIEGVLDLLGRYHSTAAPTCLQLAEEAELSDEELFPTYEALGLLGLAVIEKAISV